MDLNLPVNPDPELVCAALQEIMGKQVDPEYLSGIKQVVPGEQPSYGIRVPVLRDLALQILKTYGKDPEVVLPIARHAWEMGWREWQLIALFLLADIQITVEARWDLGVEYLPEVSNWELCDQLCGALLGQALAENPACMDKLETWIEAPDFWVRRAAIVSTVMLRRAKYDKTLAAELDRRALAICQALLDDQEHYIRKAVDWSIRETIKRNYDLGCEWMFGQTGRTLSRTAHSTLKLAAKKLSPSDRERFIAVLEGKQGR